MSDIGIESFSQLLASEDLRVELDANINGIASFDLSTRTLYIAKLKDHQQHLKTGLAIHEVGHALYDPDWETISRSSKYDLFLRRKNLFNVITDGFQERMTCMNFPGAKKHLRDIFTDLLIPAHDDCPARDRASELINTINYNAKGKKHGFTLEYPDYVEEDDRRLFISAEDTIDTDWRCRLILADLVWEAVKKYRDEEEEREDSDCQEEAEANAEEAEADEADMDSDTDETEEDEDAEDSDEDDDESDDSDTDADVKVADHTDKVEALIEQAANLMTYEQLEQSSIVVDIAYKNPADNSIDALFDVVTSLKKNYQDRLRLCRMAASTMYSRFTSRVDAKNFSNVRYQTSGSIDAGRLPFYQISEEIFQKSAVTHDQTNHAFCVMLDYSASMQNSLLNLFDRTLELTLFAVQAEVELEVWLYTGPDIGNEQRLKMADMAKKNPAKSFISNTCKFISVVNTRKMGQSEIMRRMHMLFTLCSLQANDASLARRNWNQKFDAEDKKFFGRETFRMGSTCIQEALIFGDGRLTRMQSEKKQLFLLTDGQDDATYYAWLNKSMPGENKIWSKKNTHYPPIGYRSVKAVYWKGKKVYDQNTVDLTSANEYEWRGEMTQQVIDILRGAGVGVHGICWDSDARKNKAGVSETAAYVKKMFGPSSIIIDSLGSTVRSIADQLTDKAAEQVNKRKAVAVNNKIIDEVVECLLGRT